MDQDFFNTPLDLRQIQVTDDFWHAQQELVRTEVLPYQWDALNDHVPGAEPSYCIHNFRAAARRMRRRQAEGTAYVEPAYTERGFQVLPDDPAHPDPDKFYGYVFQDTDLYKWIEAAAYSLAQHPDSALEKTVDEAIDLICAAQHESGYLDTYYILNGMDMAFTNLKDNHELYCLGHLAESAAAYYRVTGKEKLLRAACRFADCAAEKFGPQPGQCRGYPGHEIAEMGLTRLYEATGEEKYLTLSRFFLDERGTQSYYFDEEARRRAERAGRPYKPDANPDRYAYHQAHLPVREQREAVGHAVRAMYLYAGMADAARLTGDSSLYDACRRLWDSVVREKLYVTGGIGGTVHGEAFSYPFDLPSDSAYSETCAAIGLVFFARRMLSIAPKAEYADVMEMALYNTVSAGMSLDGRSFFYVNPLETNPEACRRDERLRHVKPVRQKWFGCACCPPNIARTTASVASFAYTENADTLWTHLYIGGEVTKRAGDSTLTLSVQSTFPYEGDVQAQVRADAPVSCTLAFRLPGWCGSAPEIAFPVGIQRTDWDGYCYLTGTWQPGDIIRLRFPMPLHMYQAHPKVRENSGKVAFARGPITYCMEEADNGKDLHLCTIDPARTQSWKTVQAAVCGRPMLLLDIPGLREEPPQTNALYRDYTPAKTRAIRLRFIPYFAWANRGEGEMRVWVRTSHQAARD